MNHSGTRWLVLLALGVLAFILFFERRTRDTDQRATQDTRLFRNLVPGEVNRLDMSRGTNYFLRLERQNALWGYTLPMRYPAQVESVAQLLIALAQLRPQATLSAQDVLAQPNRWAAFGLEPPAATVVVSWGSQRLELHLGAPTLLGNQVYLQVVGRDGLVTVDAEFLQRLPATLDAWRDTSLLRLAQLDYDRVEVRPGTNGFEVVRHATNGLWRMTKPLQTSANSARLNFLLQQLELSRVRRFVTDDPRADLEPFGLQPPERELVFGRGTNDLLVLQIGRSPTNDPAQVFVRHGAYTNVVLTAREPLEPWLARYPDFCDRRMMVFRPEAVDRIEARADEAFVLQRGTNQLWRLVEPLDLPADTALVTDFLSELAAFEFQKFEKEVATDFAAYGLAPPRRQYLLKTTAPTNLPAPTNAVVAQVDLGNAAGYATFARRSQENSVVTVVVGEGRLPHAAYQLRDRRLWNFSTNQIASLTVRQEGRTRTMLRTGALQWSLAPGSEGTINPLSLEEAAFRLGQLRAQSWVASGTNQLARYGFPALDHRVTVTLLPADRPQSYEVRFGRLAPSRRPYAAVELPGEPGPLIFECPQSVADLVRSDLTLPPPAPGAGK